MLDDKIKRGFSPDVLMTMNDPRIRTDNCGHFIMSLSENSKVYFEDFYRFLELAFERTKAERKMIDEKIASTPAEMSETLAYYRARGIIVDLTRRTIERFYSDGTNFGIVMTPWCFGTVVLEKIEVYRERISRGDVSDPNIVEYPYDVLRYIDEIHRTALLELFDFPETAFQMRWQYSELLKKYSKILSGINSSLHSVLSMIKTQGRR